MLPNLNDLAAGLGRVRACMKTRDWLSDPDLAASYLTMVGGGLDDSSFRGVLQLAAEQHGWDARTIADIVRGAVAVDQLDQIARSDRSRPDPDRTAQWVLGGLRPQEPRTYEDVPFSPQSFFSTVAAGITVGQNQNGDAFRLPYGSISIAARRGGGKSVLLHDIIAGLAQTVDATIWVGDTIGELLVPWMQTPMTRRIIGWPAVGAEGVGDMLDAALHLVNLRKIRGAARMNELNTDVYPISQDDPAVVVVVDAETLAEPDLARKVFQLRRIGRAMQVNVITALPGTTAEWLPRSDLKVTQTLVAGQFDDAGEYSYYFGTTKLNIAPTQPGVFTVKERSAGGSDLQEFRAMRATPKDIAGFGAELDERGHRPPLLPEWAATAIDAYGQRWERDEVQLLIERVEG